MTDWRRPERVLRRSEPEAITSVAALSPAVEKGIAVRHKHADALGARGSRTHTALLAKLPCHEHVVHGEALRGIDGHRVAMNDRLPVCSVEPSASTSRLLAPDGTDDERGPIRKPLSSTSATAHRPKAQPFAVRQPADAPRKRSRPGRTRRVKRKSPRPARATTSRRFSPDDAQLVAFRKCFVALCVTSTSPGW